MAEFDCSEWLKETIQELREDAPLLKLTLLGAQISTDSLTLTCLLRLADYLNQHVNDVWVLCRKCL